MQPVAIRQRTRAKDEKSSKPVLNWPAFTETFMGIDPSLTATGVAILVNGRVRTFVLSPKERGAERLAWFRQSFTELFQNYRPTQLAIEGYSFGSKFSHSHSLGELGGVLRLAARDCRLPTIIVPPNTLKQFATGKGNAGKEVIIKEAFKRWSIDVSDNNEADAAVLSLMASAAAATPPMTSVQAAAMKKVECLV